MKKIILDLCGGTGSWSKPYKDAGYDVRVITLPKYDILRWREYPEVIEPVEAGEVYGIFAAPPCTMFSFARTRAFTPRDLVRGMKIVRVCMDIIWSSRENGKLKFWALENPKAYLRQFLGKPPLTFNPYEYGDPYLKKTDIWGYFDLPRKNIVEVPEEIKLACREGRRTGKYLPQLPEDYLKPRGDRTETAQKAMTPPGFALAFYKANK